MPNATKFRPFATYNPEGDTFTLHFYLGREIGGAVEPCVRCGQTMSGIVGPLGICSGGPTSDSGGKRCNETMFPYLEISRGDDYHDWEVTVEQLAVTRLTAVEHLTEDIEPPEPDGWYKTGLQRLIRCVDEAMTDRAVIQRVMNSDRMPICEQCGFKLPCSCAAFEEVTKCQDTTP